MANDDYYNLLGVGRQATKAEIKKAYRRQAAKYHPDKHQGDKKMEEKFKEIQEAYEVLHDDQKRQVYDQYGREGLKGQGGFGGAQGFGDLNDVFGGIFNDFFGGGQQQSRSRAQKGQDIGYQMTITLEEAVKGVTKTISIPISKTCGDCNGSGAKAGTSPVTCHHCNGSGQTRIQQGFLSIQQTCPYCSGTGKIIKEYCTTCNGSGRMKKQTDIEIKLPAGIDTGDRLRLTGKGESGSHGGPNGDLFVEVNIKPHRLFERKGADLYCSVPISFAQAAFGGEIEVPTLDSKLSLKLPKETQSGKLFRLRGKGVTSLKSSRPGDLFCTVCVETPVNLNQQQQEYLKAFQQSLTESNEQHNPKSKSWFTAIRNFFDDVRK